MIYTNYLAVLAAAIAGMVLGYLWYGPLFGADWTALMGWKPDAAQKLMAQNKKKMMTNYTLMFVGLLLMAFTLSHLVSLLNLYSGFTGVVAGLEGAFMSWFGFVLPASLGAILWEGRHWRLWVLNSGYYLIILLVMGIILGAWM